MQLRELEINGFKSFATSTRLAFDRGITAIIGPNGSGKSNVAEAIRWVLGEQSLKALRGRQTEDVIFAGGKDIRRSGSARVALTLQNESGRLAVEAPEVTITRSINRSGEGEYLLNGDPVRRLDVHQLLAQAGFGTKSYAVISQGMVDQYLTATPQGRRELFDEACGVKALQLKLNQAERKLTQTAEHLHELRVVAQELKPRLLVLQRQVKRHEEREHLTTEFAQLQTAFYHRAWHTHQQTLAAAAAHVQAARQESLAARQARQQAEADLHQLLAAGASSNEGHLRALKQRRLEAEQALEQATTAYEERVRQRAALSASIEKVRAARRTAEEHLEQSRTAADSPHGALQLRTLLHQTSAAITELLAGGGPDVKQWAALRDELAQAAERLDGLSTTDTAQTLAAQLEAPLQAVARLQAIEEERAQQLRQLPALDKPSDEAVRQLHQALSDARGEHSPQASSEERLTKTREAEVAAERAASAAEVAHTQAHTDLERLKSEINREQGTAWLESISHQTPPAETVSRQQLSDVAGRLASLGEIDPLALKEYEEVKERYETLQQHMSDAETALTNTQQLVRSLKGEITTRFRSQFAAINKAFQQAFKQLFGGGEAQLSIVEVPAEEAVEETIAGIDVAVRLPGKQLKGIHFLSGGEKTLTSLALLMAIVQVQQPPFVVLDEVDAALDEANSIRFSDLLESLAETTQCIVITHNRETMSRASVLYGITMPPDSASQVYSVKLDEIAEAAAEFEV